MCLNRFPKTRKSQKKIINIFLFFFWYSNSVRTDLESFLETGKEFDCIISNNDAMALGAIKALENKGIDPSSIPIVGIDATADAVEAIQNGTMSMSVFQSAAGQAEAAIRIAKSLIDGKPAGEGTDCTVSDECDSLFYVPFEKVTSENVNDYAK